jgi:hypothetical protein
MEWRRFATKSARCFTFPIPRSPAERQGQADAIRREGRVYCFAVQWVTPEAFAAMEREQRRWFHRTVRPFMRDRV